MSEVSVLIPSCDPYSDLWKPFFNLFWRHWRDCKYPVYLSANHKRCADDRVKTILVGNDVSWSDGVLTALDEVETEYIIFMLEDFFLQSKIDNSKIEFFVQLMRRIDGALLRLVPNPGPDIQIKGLPVGIISKSAPYRISTQGAIWKKAFLKQILKRGESAWEFELNGTKRSRRSRQNFYGTIDSVLTYRNHVVERGKWFAKDARLFGAMNIGCDFSQRKIMTVTETFLWHVDHKLSSICRPLPGKLKSRIRKIAQGLL